MLTKKFENLPIAKTNFEVKNSLYFMERIKNITLQEDEILISFVVSSLFPSVPMPQTLEYLRELLQKNSLQEDEVNLF